MTANHTLTRSPQAAAVPERDAGVAHSDWLLREHHEDQAASVIVPIQPMPRAGMLVAERFLVERELGSGGMGIVYAARDQRMGGRRVALKWLRAGVMDARAASARLMREAFAAINHPNVVCVHDVDAAHPFIVMELLEGMSLGERIREGEIGIGEACSIVLQTLDGLAAVHARGLIHRDLKPENIFLTRDAQGRVVPKILDFGLVKLTTSEPGRWTTTAAGTVMGTPAYMAPEQLCARPVDARTDLYALSVVFYEMMTRHLPYVGKTAMELAASALEGRPVPPSGYRTDLPVSIERVILKGMSVGARERWKSAADMARGLREAMLDERPRRAVAAAERSRWAWAGGGMLMMGGVLVLAWSLCTPSDSVVVREPPPLPTAPVVVHDEAEQTATAAIEIDDDDEVASAARELEKLMPGVSVGERDIQAELERAVSVGSLLQQEIDELGKRMERKVAEAVRKSGRAAELESPRRLAPP